MTRVFDGDTLVLATHNKGKVVELQDMLCGAPIRIVTAGDLNLPEPEETGTTFAENASLKALAAARAANLPALADDSGLCVNALGGDPGLYSARWAGPDKDFDFAMGRVNELLGDNPDRSAYFIAVLALAWPDGHVELSEGRVEGELVWPKRGEGGFGYDPMFLPDGYTQTFGEMSAADKKAISHRQRALTGMVGRCFTHPIAR